VQKQIKGMAKQSFEFHTTWKGTQVITTLMQQMQRSCKTMLHFSKYDL
jgi:hypothetical protein